MFHKISTKSGISKNMPQNFTFFPCEICCALWMAEEFINISVKIVFILRIIVIGIFCQYVFYSK